MELEEMLQQLKKQRLSAGIQMAFYQAMPRTSPEQIEQAEKRLGIRFHPDYRRFLEEASHGVYGPLEPAVITLPGSRLDLITIAERAWQVHGVPRDLLPICEHGSDYFCLNPNGEVVHWQEKTEEAPTWSDLASWMAQLGLNRLAQSSGSQRVDEILTGCIGIFEAQFPGRIHSYYLEGSQSDAQAVSTSDIDLIILFKTQPDAEETRRIARAREACQLLCPLLDIRVRGLDMARRFGVYGFNLRSRLLRGEDARDQIPVLPLEDYIRTCLHAPYYFMCANLRDSPEGLPYPLAYPDLDGEFFGYNKPLRRSLDGVERDGLKDFVVCIVWAARAIALLKARRHLSPRNSDGVRLYKEWIGDEWTPLLEELLEKSRHQWHYVVPDNRAERSQLRQLCERALGFENHYLEVYKDYLIDQMERAEKPEAFWFGMASLSQEGLDETTARLFAIARLEQLRFDHDDVLAALGRARESEHPKIRAAAEKVLSG